MRANIVKLVYLLTAGMVAAMVYLMLFSGEHGTAPLKKANVNLSDKASLQRGAAAFRDYCFNCHGLSAVRYNQLAKIGLSEDDIKQYMLPSKTTKVGDMMVIGMNAADAKKWFGATPPDLSLMASAKGTDYIYSYLNGFYKDDARPTGWNNLYLPNAAMPNVLWEEQGTLVPTYEEKPNPHEGGKVEKTISGYVKATAGKRDEEQYARLTNDITNFLYWAAEPDRSSRHWIGIFVLAFLVVLLLLARALSKNYWKDVH